MKIVRNSIIPFKGFVAINLFGILFVRKECRISEILINHEAIHTALMKEWLYIGFYIIYLFNWIFNLFKYKFDNKLAYRNIWFEKEAYKYERDLDYLKRRKHYGRR